ncbi:hypothetical protein GCM10011428_57460 [Streptomyces violaceus]
MSLAGTRHDVLNDVTHAHGRRPTVVLFLERLRLSTELAPIAVAEDIA